MTKTDPQGFLIAGMFMTAFLACLAVAAFMSNTPVEGDERETIPCPEGYTDCTGIPVATPEATPVPEPTPAETPFSCSHKHEHHYFVYKGRTSERVAKPVFHIHEGLPHLNDSDATGRWQDYDPHRCGHE